MLLWKRHWEEWEIPREPGDPWPEGSVAAWLMLRDESDIVKQAALLGIVNRELGRSYTLSDLPEQPRDEWEPEATELHAQWWKLRIARQKEIDASIATHAEYEYLYDKPYEDRSKVRVAGPFTVESISPHRVLGVDENGDVIDGVAEPRNGYSTGYDFGARSSWTTCDGRASSRPTRRTASPSPPSMPNLAGSFVLKGGT